MNALVLLRDTGRFFGQHWLRLFSITLLISAITLIVAVGVIVAVVMGSRGIHPVNLARLVTWVGGVWMSTAILYYLYAVSTGQQLSPLAAIRKSLESISSVFGYQLLLLAALLLLVMVAWLPIVSVFPLLDKFPYNLWGFVVLFYFGSRLVALGMIDLVVNQTDFKSLVFSAWRISRGHVWTLLIAHLIFFAAIALVFIILPLVEPYLLLQMSVLVLLIQPVVILFYIFIFQIYAHQRPDTDHT